MLTKELQLINPLHVAYSYERRVVHDFEKNGTLAMIFTLSLSNMMPSDVIVNCKVEAVNEWSSLSDPTDISDGNGFIWVGKT